MTTAVNLISSALASSLRGWQGIRARTDTEQPAQLLKLYDIENCCLFLDCPTHIYFLLNEFFVFILYR